MSASVAHLAARRDRRARTSATIAALAVGAAQEVPQLAPLAAVLIALATRGGRPARVGTGVGVAVALASRAAWSVAPHHPAEVARVLRRPERLAASDGQGLHVVANRSANQGSGSDPIDEIVAALPAAVIVEPGDDEDLVSALQRAAVGATALGVVGGDGSINAAAGVAIEHGLPLAAFPGGTLNHFARDVGLPDVGATIRAVAAGDVAEVDVGTIAGQPFLNTASFGSYADLVDAREGLEDRIGKWPALAIALVGVLRSATPIPVEVDGRAVHVWMIFIGNCCYRPEGLAPAWRERLDDRRLDVRFVDGSHPYSRLRLVLALATGRLGASAVYEQHVVTSLHVRSLDGPLRLARDGETFDGPDVVEVVKHHQRLVVYTPAD